MGKYDKWTINDNDVMKKTKVETSRLVNPGSFVTGTGIGIVGTCVVLGAFGPVSVVLLTIGGLSVCVPLAVFLKMVNDNRRIVNLNKHREHNLSALDYEDAKLEKEANIANNRRIININQAAEDSTIRGLDSDKTQVAGTFNSPRIVKAPSSAVKNEGTHVKDVDLRLPDEVLFYPTFAKSQHVGGNCIPIGIGQSDKLILIKYTNINHFLISGKTETGKSSIFKCIVASEMLMGLDTRYYVIDLKSQTFNRFGVSDRIATDPQKAINMINYIYDEGQRRKTIMDRGYDSFQEFLDDKTQEKLPLIRFIIDELISLVSLVESNNDISADNKKKFISQMVVILTTYRIYGIFVGATVQNINAKNFPGGSTARGQFKTSIAFASKDKNTSDVMLGEKLDLRKMKIGQVKILSEWINNSTTTDVQTVKVSPEDMEQIAKQVDVFKYFPETPLLIDVSESVNNYSGGIGKADIRKSVPVNKDKLAKAVLKILSDKGGCKQDDIKTIIFLQIQRNSFRCNSRDVYAGIVAGYDLYIKQEYLPEMGSNIGPLAKKVFGFASNPTKAIRERVKEVLQLVD